MLRLQHAPTRSPDPYSSTSCIGRWSARLHLADRSPSAEIAAHSRPRLCMPHRETVCTQQRRTSSCRGSSSSATSSPGSTVLTNFTNKLAISRKRRRGVHVDLLQHRDVFQNCSVTFATRTSEHPAYPFAPDRAAVKRPAKDIEINAIALRTLGGTLTNIAWPSWPVFEPWNRTEMGQFQRYRQPDKNQPGRSVETRPIGNISPILPASHASGKMKR